ncbi:CoA ester lyase [Xanthobacter dioxanivorans]|uniref:CoA ester lyase n=1 Tax=Xanthobacter dioxanivorans TaxID=2528964 RepID=A0A974SLI5_9HYPH|nr:CoA ester lyase [Xanthobacter dioxanivorans]QRG09384.1 CoA ester lyase [Xanthobacter dioxanivorans]
MMTVLDIIVPLFVPGHRPERFEKAAGAAPDAVILDLEDAVPPDAKDAARANLDTGFTRRPVLVRVNASGTPWHEADMAAVARLKPAAVILPKAESPALLDGVAAVLGPDVPVIALVETAAGLAHARAVAAHPTVRRIAFGSVDFSADIGCAHVREALLAARAELVLASRLGGLAAPLDGVTTRIDDPSAASDDARYARALGFGGKLAIHPRQITPIRDGFLPDAEEIEWARKVLASGDGAANVDGAMVDEPVRIRARSILARGAPAL